MKQSYFSTGYYKRQWKFFNEQLSEQLNHFSISTRKKTSHGLWLSVLLPITLLGGAIKYRTECSFLFWHFSLLSTSFLINSVCGVLHYTNKCQVPLKQIGALASMTTSSLLLTLYSFDGGLGVYINILHSLVCAMCYHPLLDNVMKSIKHGFTYGEASIVTQTLILFQIYAYTNILFAVSEKPVDCADTATIILQVGLSCIIVLSSLVFTVISLRSTLIFYSCLALIVTLGAIIPLHIILGGSPVLWIVQLLLGDGHTVLLVIYWTVCVLVAIAVIASQISSNQKATTSLRKYFHLLAVAVFIPGLVVNRCLLYLASGVVFALFLLLEVMRLLHLPPLADVLNQGFQLYVDEKDSAVALTPLYLLTGCALPLWLSPQPLHRTDFLVLSAGVLSIGVGDCFASMVGSKCGQHKWKNSSKSIEGSVACFVSQMAFIVAFLYLDLMSVNKIWIGLIGTAVITLIEAKTDQVDNLVLPLVQFGIFLLG